MVVEKVSLEVYRSVSMVVDEGVRARASDG